MYTNHGKITDTRVKGPERMIGELKEFGDVRVVIYPIEVNPKLVKQIIMDMAMEVPGYQSEAVGAGFVSWEIAEKNFSAFGIVDIGIQDLKVE
jgi:hypothetical protein